MISAIIAAYNEEETIEDVIRAAARVPEISEIIVVDDGSTDQTSAQAKKTTAIVITLPVNSGKGHAMDTGVSRAKEDILLFLDADLRGLSPADIRHLIVPVMAGTSDMTVLARKHWFDRLYRWKRIAIGGERALRRALWDLVPKKERRDFRIELALNYEVLKKNLRIDVIAAPAVSQRWKMEKYGLLRGAVRDIHATSCMLWTIARFYLAYPLLRTLRKSASPVPPS